MSIIRKMRRQKAVYWKRTDTVDHYGRVSFESPVEIDCRWVDGSQQFRDSKGQAFNFASTIYVDRQMYVGDALRLSTLEDLGGIPRDTEEGDERVTEEDEIRVGEALLDPRDDPAAALIQRFSITPNLKATENLYTAYV